MMMNDQNKTMCDATIVCELMEANEKIAQLEQTVEDMAKLVHMQADKVILREKKIRDLEEENKELKVEVVRIPLVCLEKMESDIMEVREENKRLKEENKELRQENQEEDEDEDDVMCVECVESALLPHRRLRGVA